MYIHTWYNIMYCMMWESIFVWMYGKNNVGNLNRLSSLWLFLDVFTAVHSHTDDLWGRPIYVHCVVSVKCTWN